MYCLRVLQSVSVRVCSLVYPDIRRSPPGGEMPLTKLGLGSDVAPRFLFLLRATGLATRFMGSGKFTIDPLIKN